VTPTARFGCLLVGLLALLAGPALAQGSAPAKESKEAREAREAREATEAMERARRMAANPMRVILEASRVRRPANGETPPAPAGNTSAPAEVAARAQPAAAAATAATAAAREPEAAVISSDLAQTRAATQGAPALDPAALPPPVAVPTVAMPTMAALLPAVVRPVLVRSVNPELPPRLLADLPPNTVVTVELQLRADGSVSQVSVVTPGAAARSMTRFLVPALQQWRFEPLPSERPWLVDLVFNAE
jgi:hypothetical protein